MLLVIHLLDGQPGLPAAEKVFGQDLLGPHKVMEVKEKGQIQAGSRAI